jgi:prepilin peptidase CpaA
MPFLVTCLAIACWTDLRDRRIPNGLAALVAAVGVGGAALGWLPPLGAREALLGLATGGALWLPFYALGMLGAGDVKLFAAAAAWLGPVGALQAAAFTALVGGVVAAGMLLASDGPRLAAARVARAFHDPRALHLDLVPRSARLPYALAIAVGVLAALWHPEIR